MYVCISTQGYNGVLDENVSGDILCNIFFHLPKVIRKVTK